MRTAFAGTFVVLAGGVFLSLAICDDNVPTVSSLSASLTGKFSDIDREIARLQTSGESQAAVKLAKTLSAFKEQFAGKPITSTPENAEVHVVGVYEGMLPGGKAREFRQHPSGEATVDIQYTSAPIILVLCAYEPVKWTVKSGKDVKFKRVILGGYYKQEITGLPDNVEIVQNQRDESSDGIYFAYRQDEEHYLKLAKQLRKATGQEVTTFQGAYRYAGSPFVIGEANDVWRLQLLDSRLRPIHREATQFAMAEQRKALQAIRFSAMYLTPHDEAEPHAPFGDPAKLEWAAFTPSGPIVSTRISLPTTLCHVVADPKDKAIFGLTLHDLVTIDASTNTCTKIATPGLSWPAGLALDTRRRRLVVIGRRGEFFTYHLERKEWSSLAVADRRQFMDQDGLITPVALCYADEADTLYALGYANEKGLTRIMSFSPDGKLAGQIRLERPIPAADHLRGRSQLIAAGKQMLVLGGPVPDPDTPKMSVTSRSYLIDAANGKILFSDVLSPQADRRSLSATELEKIWGRLKDVDSNSSDQLLWELAAGEDNAVAFIASHLSPPPPVDDKAIERWLSELDANEFKTRDAAYRHLQDAGGGAVPALEQINKTTTSVEVRLATNRLLAFLRAGESDTPELRREALAMQVLARIDTPTARKLLQQTASEKLPGPRTWRAREVLKLREGQ